MDEARKLDSADEIEFLESELQNLQFERGALQQRVQELTRAKQNLEEEVHIMRAQVKAAADAIPFSPLPRLADELAHKVKTPSMEQELASLKTNIAATFHVKANASDTCHDPVDGS